jgi:nucleoside-diphosphate-sugar epimerase
MLARSQTLNIDKARQLLGYVPQQSLSEAMDDFVAWWKQKHWR